MKKDFRDQRIIDIWVKVGKTCSPDEVEHAKRPNPLKVVDDNK